MAALLHTLDYVYLALGLGFVIFFHELGHFLAAKYCDVKVDQFAVGFGPAIFAWRKGVGIRLGTTTPDYNKAIDENFAEVEGKQFEFRESLGPTQQQSAEIGKRLGLGETEYRLNWIPLGGYVKMLGQDDMRPGLTVDDPRSYTSKTVGARMMIVSAGVIMNVILAAVGFMIVFMIGYPVPPATVGAVVSMSPAARAQRADGTLVGLQPGDAIINYNDKEMSGDFSRILLNVALTRDGSRVPIDVQHPDGTTERLYTTLEKPGSDGKGLVELGIAQPFKLAYTDASSDDDTDDALLAKTSMPDVLALKPGDAITQIAGKEVDPNGGAANIARLYAALSASAGKPVDLTVKSSDGKISHTTVSPHFSDPFSKSDLNFLGLVPRATVVGLVDTSPAVGKLTPGDAVVAIDAGTDHIQNPTSDQIRTTLAEAGDKEMKVTLTVLDPGSITPRVVDDLIPNYRIPNGGGRIGLGIAMGSDEQHLVVAQVTDGSAASGKIPAGSILTAINGQAVNNWFEIHDQIVAAKAGQTLSISFVPPDKDAKPAVADIQLTQPDIDSAKEVTMIQDLTLSPMASTRHTHNPFVALSWGVGETRDLILQFYVTLQRMMTRDVGLSNVMGPVGMAHEGAKVASRGITWLIWFLCLISANLAVVNFLPIPIVDGGLFTLLILEKIQGKPLSSDAQRWVQTVGLVLMLGVFLLVTYQDIARMWGY